jgi:hypothetical protein
MKQNNLFTYAFSFSILTMSFSCQKETTEPAPAVCTTCNSVSPATMIVHIIDSNWERQGAGTYSSNFSELLKTAGISQDQIYSFFIVKGNLNQQIYPNSSTPYWGGTLGLNNNNQIYQFTFKLGVPSYYGESPQDIPIPFQSVDVILDLIK